MHTVVETRSYLAAAEKAGLSEEERDAIVAAIASNPLAGTEIVGTGGCRKVRFPAQGRGKSGGVRTITFYSGTELPVFLLTLFAKSDRSDLTQAERNELRKLSDILVTTYRRAGRRP